MTIDQELLNKARTASEKLSEAEKQSVLSRAEYHTSIRRLHLAGGSLREIAEALGVSHQRVQQIVDEAGGTWWTRVWRTRTVKRDAVCTFCGRPPGEVSKLIAGPNVYICDACVEHAEQVVAGSLKAPSLFFLSRGSRSACTFCGEKRNDGRPVVTRRESNVCGDCLRLCREILNERAPSEPPAA
jgi:bacterioferritin-associated ferredoxin